jgi:hypothetical protein
MDLFSYQLDINPLWAKDIIIALLGTALAVSLALANKKGESSWVKLAMLVPIADAIQHLPYVNYISLNTIFDDIVIATGIILVLDYITTKTERPDLKYKFINIYILLTFYGIIRYPLDVLKFTLNSVLMVVGFVLITLIPSVDDIL